jgi:hypothetical protein
MDKENLSVKEFAAAAGVSTQYIYKVLDTKLKPYKKKIGKQTFISAAAVGVITETTNATNNTTNQCNQIEESEINALQGKEAGEKPTMQPTLQPIQPTNATNLATNKDGEIEALKQLIEELKQDKEDLKKDKEDLKQEAIKWQQLLLEEKNKVKLLEAAASKETEETVIDFEEVDDSKEEVREAVPAVPKGFINKLKWLFSN